MAGDGRTAAIRGSDGRLTLLGGGRDAFVIKDWLSADGDGRDGKDKTLHDGVLCDALGCIGRLKDGRLVSMAFKTEALAEDCARAAAVISAREAFVPCAATLIDRNVLRTEGATALYWTGQAFERASARPAGYDRPWARTAPATEETASRPTPPRDATPRSEDLEADD